MLKKKNFTILEIQTVENYKICFQEIISKILFRHVTQP